MPTWPRPAMRAAMGPSFAKNEALSIRRTGGRDAAAYCRHASGLPPRLPAEVAHRQHDAGDAPDGDDRQVFQLQDAAALEGAERGMQRVREVDDWEYRRHIPDPRW